MAGPTIHAEGEQQSSLSCDLELWAQVGLSMDSWPGAEAASSLVLFVWQKDVVANVNTDIRAS